jgi:hypothetical protein
MPPRKRRVSSTPHLERQAGVETSGDSLGADLVSRGSRRRKTRVVRVALVVAASASAMFVGASQLGLWKSGGEKGMLTRPPVSAPTRESPVESRRILLPRSGYVVAPAGNFMTDAAGRIESFTLPIRCGSRQLVVRNIDASGGRIRFTGRAVGRPITVRLRARVLDRRRVRGVVSAAGSRCRAEPIAFLARLS